MSRLIILITIVACYIFTACNGGLETISVRDEDGTITEKYTRKKNSMVKEGTYIRYYKNGKKFEEATYQNNVLHGERIIYYENGEIQSVENYDQGEFSGNFKTFYENGQLQLEGNYSNNAMNGEWRGYYDNGQLKEIVQFVDNEENGPFVEYHSNGQLKAEGTYLNGDNEHGKLKLYNENGELIREMDCNKGVCTATWSKEE